MGWHTVFVAALAACFGRAAWASSATGVDLYAAVSPLEAHCLASEGISSVIARAWHSYGAVDTAACTTLGNAKSSGISHRDVYMFPCPTCSASAAEQLRSMVFYLKSTCSRDWSGKVWLDVEGEEYWLGDYSANKEFYEALVDACRSTADSCGVYASSYQWENLFGDTSYDYASDLPLWYAHYDYNATFDDYKEFGGWSTPTMKQYEGDTTLCNLDVDLDWQP